jgi:hypothetical protein
MNENQTGYRVRHYLNQGTNLNSRILSRLQNARNHALALHQDFEHGAVRTGVLSLVGRSRQTRSLFPRLFLPTIALICGVLAINALRQTQLVEEIEEIDAAMLTGELPIDAYVDIGFDTWLKRSLQ